MKPVICLEPLYPELSPEQKIQKISGHGFACVEFWNWRDKSIPALFETCQRSNVQVVNFSGHRVGSPVAEETHHLLLQDLDDAIQAAQTLGCQTLMMLTNALNPDGSVTDIFENIPSSTQYQNTITGLKQALAQTPDEIHLVLEPLNTLIDHPGYFLHDMQTASALIHDIGNPRLKILCDLYHLGVMGHDLEDVIARYLPDIGYFHVADFPGRHEPGTGSADWKTLLSRIQDHGYTGYIGFEYFPQGDSDASLDAIRTLWDAI